MHHVELVFHFADFCSPVIFSPFFWLSAGGVFDSFCSPVFFRRFVCSPFCLFRLLFLSPVCFASCFCVGKFIWRKRMGERWHGTEQGQGEGQGRVVSQTPLFLGLLFYTTEQEENTYGKSKNNGSPTDDVVKIPHTKDVLSIFIFTLKSLL